MIDGGTLAPNYRLPDEWDGGAGPGYTGLTFNETPRITTPAVDNIVVEGDRRVDRDLAANTVSDGDLVIGLDLANDEGVWTYTSLNNAIATVDSSGKVTHVSDGPVTVTATNPTLELSDSIHLTMSSQVSTPEDVFLDFDPAQNSAALHISKQVDDRIAGLTASNDTKKFLSVESWVLPLENSVVTRNPNLWASDVDLTPIALKRETTTPALAENSPGILISPQHTLHCYHSGYTPTVGTK